LKKSILVVDDEKSVRDSLHKTLEKEGYSVFLAEGGQAALDILKAHPTNVILTDLRMDDMDGIQVLKVAKNIAPEVEVVLMTAYGTVEVAVEAMKLGAYDFIEKPLKRATVLKVLEKALEKQTLLLENKYLREQLQDAHKFENIVGRSHQMKAILDMVSQIAPSSATVLITGESGTGKEVIASAIHYASPRKDKPFIKVSCAALPESLLESELFGYEKGAFTGADSRKPGRFELADGGTIFLDEISELSPAMQVKLLRVLQEAEFERLGGTKTIKVEVRIIAATNKDLTKLVVDGKFRDDLYYRLNVISIVLPPLRERKDDITLLIDHFLRKYQQKNQKLIRGIAQNAMDLLIDYDWPGNVRELENAIERAVVMAKKDIVRPEDLPSYLESKSPQKPDHLTISFGMSMEELELAYIKEALKRCDGDKELAAKLLGISSRTIYRKLNETSTDETRENSIEENS
jgi:two-component system response regulator HydG